MKLSAAVLVLLSFGCGATRGESNNGPAHAPDQPLRNIREEDRPKLRKIYSLDEYCGGKPTCTGLQFGDNMEVAFFELKTPVQIDEATTTYELESLSDVYKSLTFENCTFARFPMQLFYSLPVQELDLRNTSMEIVTWENFLNADKLSILLLSENRIEAIDLLTFNYAYHLQFLFLDSNRISRLDSESFKGLTSLTYLNLANNRIAELPERIFDYLPALQDLSLQSNLLHAIAVETFANCHYLSVVRLSDNQLTALPENLLRNQQNIILFDLADNTALSTLVLTAKAERLIANNCSLTRVNIYGSVINADLSDNRILELYFSEPQTLETLYLSNNSLVQIASLALVANLRTLSLSNNPGLDILPVPWSIKSLERLDMSGCNLNHLPMSSLADQSKLRSLNISNNKITHINPLNFKYLEQLTHFYIHANDWNCYNLRLVMDLLILPKRISYNFDKFDPEFPGEYMNGIACMYRMESTENSDSSEDSTPAETITQLDMARTANELNVDPSTEVQTLRKELKAIVAFYDSKFTDMLAQIDDLKSRLRKFEVLNADFWKQITITT